MAEISMVQMTGPAVSPGASAEKPKGDLAADFSELLRDKGQSVSDSGKKTEVKKPEKEQGQTRRPDKKVPAQEDEKQEVNESASSLENTEEGLSVLAGMVLQVQENDAVAAEGIAENVQTEPILPAAESAEPIQMPEVRLTETDTLTAAPVVLETAQTAQAAQTVQSQDPVQTRQTQTDSKEPSAPQEVKAENHTEQPRQAAQAQKPEQPRQEKNQTTAQDQGKTEMGVLKEGETAVKPEEQFAAQSTANSQFQSQISGEGTEVSKDAGVVKTSEATLYKDVAETLANRMPTEDGTLTLELEPASLGKIIIKVAFEGGKTVMSLMADSQKTLSILSQRAGEMAQILEEKTGQQTVIYTPENQSSQEELPGRGGEENRQRQRDAQEEKRHDKESESFMQQLRLGLVG